MSSPILLTVNLSRNLLLESFKFILGSHDLISFWLSLLINEMTFFLSEQPPYFSFIEQNTWENFVTHQMTFTSILQDISIPPISPTVYLC